MTETKEGDLERYYLFAGYADVQDGLGDFIGTYETLEEAQKAAPTVYWAHICVFDGDTCKTVSRKLFTDDSNVDRWRKITDRGEAEVG